MTDAALEASLNGKVLYVVGMDIALRKSDGDKTCCHGRSQLKDASGR
jgi:hypothetical protein